MYMGGNNGHIIWFSLLFCFSGWGGVGTGEGGGWGLTDVAVCSNEAFKTCACIECLVITSNTCTAVQTWEALAWTHLWKNISNLDGMLNPFLLNKEQYKCLCIKLDLSATNQRPIAYDGCSSNNPARKPWTWGQGSRGWRRVSPAIYRLLLRQIKATIH